jgi:hypothetical protein
MKYEYEKKKSIDEATLATHGRWAQKLIVNRLNLVKKMVDNASKVRKIIV